MNKAFLNHATSTASAVAAVLGASLLVAACASSVPTRYYTLLPAAQDSVPVPSSSQRQGGYALKIQPVRVPAAIDSPQLLVRESDGRILPQESDRWLGPLGDEIRGAVVAQLTSDLGVPEASSIAVPAGMPAYWVKLDVARFDSVRGQYALQEINWSLRSENSASNGAEDKPAVLLCLSRQVVKPAGDSVEALVTAHQQALRNLGVQIEQLLNTPAAQWRCP